MNKLDKYIIQNIIDFLPNYDVFHFEKTDKYFNELFKDTIIYNKIKYRKHPLVFNLYDNICYKCNINIILLDDVPDIIRCVHH